MSKTVGIIGFGDFGKLLVRELSPYFDVLVFDRQSKTEPAVAMVDVREVLNQNIIIPAIPSQFFEDFFNKYAQLVNPQALVVDVCSVKVKPQEILQRLLPPSCEILATHPLFGPNTTSDGIAGKKIMMYPARIDKMRYQKIKQFVSEKLQLTVVEKTPEEHDQQMAYVQGLSHYIGRVMQEMDVPEAELSTRAYDDLLDMRNIQGNDSWDLFKSIMEENPFASEVNKTFKQAIKKVDDKLSNG